jgi:DivIVA domain-containing protein
MKKKDMASDDASAWASAPGGRITPQEVQQKEFRVARFGAGYRMREVDEFLDQVTDAMSALVAENERLGQGPVSGSPASSRPSTPLSLPPQADDAGRAAVDAFLRREKGFLQDLGGLVQAHAEELRSMVRDVRREVAGPAAAASPVESRVEPAPTSVTEPRSSPDASPGPSPDASPGPSPDASTEPDEPPEETVQHADPMGTTEQVTRASDIPEDETQGTDTDASEGEPITTTGTAAEEPIRLDEPEPARSGRSDEEEEGSLRELFWGEE